jgi:tRNA(fMet)-specific endonuclease VapC
MSYLLDTNACIELLRDPRSEVAKRLETIAFSQIVLCSVVKAELYYGALRSTRPEHSIQILKAFSANFASLAFDDQAAEVYGQIRAHLAQRGALIGPNDLLIAAIAVSHQVTLVTHNTDEFGRVPGLEIEDWQVQV